MSSSLHWSALDTANLHASDADITLFGNCFCPFVQRVWVAFEYLAIPYRVHEVDPYKKPEDLLQVSPKGLVPALKLHTYRPPRAVNESTVILEYLEDLAEGTTGRTLLPSRADPYARALVRLQADHISRTLVPAFYRFLQAQRPEAQTVGAQEFSGALEQLASLLERGEREVALKQGPGSGLWYEHGDLNWTDVLAGPWLFRTSVVLKHYRAFELPPDSKFRAWLDRLFAHPSFKATCSTEQLYLDSYERYAFNRPNTSQVADAINSGFPLP
ncbi:glutathione S-transferase [Russula brevipes]|nr:glutathione S-transferase [Russula brevipes]